ncbi:hypothetical protein MYX76_07915 [Desulfobacterota bacterium AH_259_B03_O07]|nr:hypothetical protein [Desulfobacterota bacterium AH_259_B03_O07]
MEGQVIKELMKREIILNIENSVHELRNIYRDDNNTYFVPTQDIVWKDRKNSGWKPLLEDHCGYLIEHVPACLKRG